MKLFNRQDAKFAKITLLFLTAFAFSASWRLSVEAQEQCGVVSSIAFPVDRSVFQVAQGYSVPSPRHQGRYHTGEDYYGGRGISYGQPVRAIADGRVTYSAPTGWGRDGGVVIIEHTFPDSSIVYSMYGHMEQTDTNPFPARYSCIKGGDVVGVVGNARPVPHLHFEIRQNQPDVPGAGYTPELPATIGWRQPSKFVLNWGAWLLPMHVWHLEAGSNLIAPPLELPDHSFLFLDSTRLRFSTLDGRVLWRINLEKPALGLMDFNGLQLLVYADGTIQAINPDGTFGELYWTAPAAIDQVFPADSGDHLLLHTIENTLILFNATLGDMDWRLENIPPIVQSTSANVIGLMTESNELLTVSPDGELLDRAQLDEPASMTTRNNNLVVYAKGGLWQIDTEGTWALAIEQTPPGGRTSAALQAPDGRLFLLSGEDVAGLYAYNVDGSAAWQISLPDVSGRAQLAQYGNVLLITTNAGNITAVQAESGALCNSLRIYGDEQARLWQQLGDDGILRVSVADQVLGLDWVRLIGGCTP
jgi:murein DD-endopeptidase MepM/ murein hydrolase activator NlpD